MLAGRISARKSPTETVEAEESRVSFVRWGGTHSRAINPTILSEMLDDPDPKRAKRVMEAMLKMNKIEIEGLKQAYDGTSQQ